MNKTKSIFLFLLLIFPVLIYLFLQGFGKNQFAIPIYFENGLSATQEGCNPLLQKGPYQLDLALVSELLGTTVSGNGITVYELGNRDNGELKNNLYTFLEKYRQNTEVKLLSIKSQNDTSISSTRYSAWQDYNLPDSNLLIFGRCILQLDLNANLLADSGLVLVDRQQQIRGYYDPLKLREIDRLNTELYILLSE